MVDCADNRRSGKPLAVLISALLMTACGASSTPSAPGAETGDAAAGSIQFAVPRNYPGALLTSLGSASNIDTADFDRDGYPDFVIGNTGGGPVLLRGGPDGAFGPPSVIPAYLDTDSFVVRVADFNGDGLADIAAGSNLTSRLTVLLGDGHGDFAVSGQYFLGAPPTDLAIADFDGDGVPDIIAGTYAGLSLTVLPGNGDGTLRRASSIPVGVSTLVLYADDFNGDGITDLAFTDLVEPTHINLANPLGGTLNVWLGNGDATFRPQGAYTVGTIAEVIQYGDIDEDGIKDLLVTNAVSNDVSILHGLGAGVFEPEQRFSVGPPVGGLEGMRLADFDGDGHLDLAVSQITTRNVRVFKGDGRGDFAFVARYPVATFPEQFLAVDLDGDRCPDLAVNGNLPDLSLSDPLRVQVSVLINQSTACR
ncbi:MAG TPA: VCBS repeat-containing protein [Solimonas sp.]|nr:VCBS repeat-containing protein [Solimonas sp.]